MKKQGPADTPAPRRLESIQMLRAVAATLVVFFHMCNAVLRFPDMPSHIRDFYSIGPWGACGVDIFFVISGFIMFYITAAQPGGVGAARHFLWRRVLRIYPLYLAAAGSWMLFHLAGVFLAAKSFAPSYVIASFALFPTLGDGTSQAEGAPLSTFLLPGWTLVFEMYFYIVFALALILWNGKHKFAAAILVFLIAETLAQAMPESGLRELMTSPLILEFLMGMGAAWLFLRFGKKIEGAPLFIAGIVLMLLTIRFNMTYGLRAYIWGPCAFLIVTGASVARVPHNAATKLLGYLGDASYSIYCSHIFVAFALGIELQAGRLRNLPADALILGAMLLALPFGAAVYEFIEKPLSRLAHAYLDPGRARAKP
jgi:peptidoglycan/LPS O-acetylase OafA/YrhL